MTHETDADDNTARPIKSIDTVNRGFPNTSVQARLEADIAAVDDAASLVARFRVAQRFDDAEAHAARPTPLSAFYHAGEYAAEGPGSSGEWLVAEDISNSVANLEVWR